MPNTEITVLILTFNAGHKLESLLRGLQKQTMKPTQILVVDSESTDGTSQLAESRNCKVIRIDRVNFDHGATRTLAAKEANGEFIFLLTQDVLPCDEFVIENIIKSFMEDIQIGAAFGRQVPYPNASVFAGHLRLFNYPDASYVRTLEDRKKYGIKTAFLSNSFAAYRRLSLEKIGYFKSGLIFGEDTCAAADMLLKNQKVAYVADAKVFHSHNYTICQDFKRYFDMGVFHRNEDWLLKQFGNAEDQGFKYIESEFKFLLKARAFGLLPEFVLRNFMKFLGYKLGMHHAHIPENISRRFSMNQAWWDKRKTS